MNLTTERFTNNFDFLRVMAALLMAFSHSYALLNQYPVEPFMLLTNHKYDGSFIALGIFFSISGFLITKSAVHSTSLLHYAWKRFLRIQPLLIVVTLLSIFLIGPLFTGLDMRSYFSSPETYTYLRNSFPATGIQFGLPGVFEHNLKENGINGSLWTLIVEERLYIFTALIFFLQHKYKKPYILLIVFYNLLYIWNQKIGQFSSSNLLNGQSAYYALMFLNAGLFYLSGYDFKQKPSVFYILLIGLLLAVSLIFPAMDYFQLIFFPLLVIVVAYLRMPTNKAGKWGDFTYGIYIFSFPVQQMLIAFAKGSLKPLQLFAYTVAICLPLAILSWHILEKKMLKLKDRIK